MSNYHIIAGYKGKKAQHIITLQLISFEEDGLTFVYAPALDLTGYGKNEDEAKRSFEITLKEFVKYTDNKSAIVKELEKHGWVVKKKGNLNKGVKAPSYIDMLENNFEIIKPENVTLKNQTTIYGELIKVGGAKPKLWVKLLNGKLLDFFVSKEQAQQLSPKVYTEVALKGEAEWNILTKDLIGFKLYDSIEYKVGGVSNAFKQLREVSSGFWDTLKTDDEITNYLKG